MSDCNFMHCPLITFLYHSTNHLQQKLHDVSLLDGAECDIVCTGRHHWMCYYHVLQDTGTELMPTDIKYYQEFGGEKVIFEKEEVTEMKKFGEPGMHVCSC